MIYGIKNCYIYLMITEIYIENVSFENKKLHAGIKTMTLTLILALNALLL